MPAHPEVTAALEDAARVLQAEGAEVRTVTLPSLNEFAAVNRVILCSEAWSIHAPWLRSRPGDYGQLVAAAADAGRVHECRRLCRRATPAAADDRRGGRRVPRLSMCCCVQVRWTRRAGSRMRRRLPRTYPRQARTPFNVTGHPALAMMAGLASNGLPVSVQFVGRYFDDATVLRVARRMSAAPSGTRGAPIGWMGGITNISQGKSETRGFLGYSRMTSKLGTHFARLLLAAAAAALCRLGQSDRAAAAAGARRPRPLPQLGLGRRGAARAATTSSRRTCAAMAIPRGRRPATTRWRTTSTTSRSSSISRSWRRSPIVAHSLGGNIALRYAGIYPEAVHRLVAIEGLGPAPRRTGAKRWQADRRTDARLDRRTARALPAGCRGATPRSRMRCARMQEENKHLSAGTGAPSDAARREPERGRHL